MERALWLSEVAEASHQKAQIQGRKPIVASALMTGAGVYGLSAMALGDIARFFEEEDTSPV